MCQPLHWCLKIGNRRASIDFYRDFLGMKVLRHEEFDKGCEATCNGPYDNKWSKTILGYGDEMSNFSLELTYNYPISSYKIGNDLKAIIIKSTPALRKAQVLKKSKSKSKMIEIKDPDGYRITLVENDNVQVKRIENIIEQINLNVSDIKKSRAYWHDVLGLDIISENSQELVLVGSTRIPTRTETVESICYGPETLLYFKIKLSSIGQKIDHGTGWGRIAFAVEESELHRINKIVQEKNYNILHSFVTLSTPNKNSVSVIILTDPDGYEICLVDVEGYTRLCYTDINANRMLEEAIKMHDNKKLNPKVDDNFQNLRQEFPFSNI